MKIRSSYFSRLLLLKLLAPDIVEAILNGRQPEGITLPGLMEPFPVEWERQFGEAGADNAEQPPDCPHRLGGALACGHRTMLGTIIPSYLDPSALPLLRIILSRTVCNHSH
jgi:hypothetical protein